MKKQLILFYLLIVSIQNYAQRLYRYGDTGKSYYKEFDLIHTKLKLDFVFEDQTANGEAWISLKPHFKATNKLTLDAKAMNIYSVKVFDKEVKYHNTDFKLNIDLGKVYTAQDTIQIYVKYKANPEKVKMPKGQAVTDSKGLYFINPNGTELDKPTQIWTQGEPESSSVWFPTIDSPNQKTTEEITLTVPNKYKTLSNGLLISQAENEDGTRTDYWKQTLPHPPYLFFIGVGDFSIIKHEWKGKEVSYYVESEYADTANELFKGTKPMLDYFSELTGIPYPWDKYAQMIVRDYVSGAMENTGAVIHMEKAMLSKGQLAERNTWERVIAHELFHHWFGDLVTTESWANITVNESFANYSEYLWLAHAYGSYRADEHLKGDRDAYLNSEEDHEKDLVRYIHNIPDDVFDVVSYNKGGLILHMLRDYLGDDIFFKGLNRYLINNQYKSAEAHQLRLAFEEVSGEDLMWFFSQWYYSNSHPKLKINYQNDVLNDKLVITVTQKDKEFDFYIVFDIYEKGKRSRQKVFVTKQQQKFEFPYKYKPELIVANANHILLAEIEEPEKNTEELIKLYELTDHYDDKIYALEKLKDLQSEKKVFELYTEAINDQYESLAAYAINNINLSGKYAKKSTINKIKKLAENESYIIQGAAVGILSKLVNEDFLPVFENKFNSISPTVKGNALLGVYYLSKDKAVAFADNLDDDTKKYISFPLLEIYLKEKKDTYLPFITKYTFLGLFTRNEKMKKLFADTIEWIMATDNTEAIKNMVKDLVKNGNMYRRYGLDYASIEFLRKVKTKQEQSKPDNYKEHIDIINKGIEGLAN